MAVMFQVLRRSVAPKSAAVMVAGTVTSAENEPVAFVVIVGAVRTMVVVVLGAMNLTVTALVTL